MGTTIDLTAADGFVLPAYLAQPAGKARGAVVVLQEIFGVNTHVRAVADSFAAQGYLAIAPHLFHRISPGVDAGYTDQDVKDGIARKGALEALPAPGPLADIQAAVDHVAAAGKVGVVGYCYGGLLAWRTAAQLRGVAAAVAYYGGGMTTPDETARRPRVPVLAHFGEQDHSIALATVQAFSQAHPEVAVHLYPAAGHGFNCDLRGSFHAESAALARERTLQFFEKQLAPA